MAERAQVGQDQEVDDSAFVFSPVSGPAAELKPHSPERLRPVNLLRYHGPYLLTRL